LQTQVKYHKNAFLSSEQEEFGGNINFLIILPRRKQMNCFHTNPT